MPEGKAGRSYIAAARRSYIAEQYPRWARNNRLRASDLRLLRNAASGFRYRPLVSILVPVYNPEEAWISRALDSVLGQVYPDWELCVCNDASTKEHVGHVLSRYERLDQRIKVEHLEKNAGISKASNAALSLASGEYVALLDHDDELTPDALFEVVKLLQEQPEADFIYSDEDIVDETGKSLFPHFKPDWSPDLLMSYNYITHLMVLRRNLLEEIGGFREGFEGSQDYDVALRYTERTDEIHHIPKLLYRWWRVGGSAGTQQYPHERSRRALSEALERRGISGTVEDGLRPHRFRVKPEIKDEPKVSIIIPTRDNVSMLRNCVESIERLTAYRNYEILIVDNDSADPQTVEYLASIPHRVLPFREEFNYSRVNNFGVSHAEGEYLLLLNDDTEVISGEWLEAMLEHAQRPEIGAVGARLTYPDGRIEHAGILVGIGHPFEQSVATHSHLFHPANSAGYVDATKVIRNYSAVTAACMMLRKEVFEGIGGFDEENLPILFNDVDLCLRLREQGYLILYTPYAELYHQGSASRKPKGYLAEGLYMLERWDKALKHDPYYNPNLSHGDGDFNLRADRLRPQILRATLSDGRGIPGVRDSHKNVLVPARPHKPPGAETSESSPQNNGR